jgi:autotransporter family porin
VPRLLLIAACLLSLAAAGCGDDDKQPASFAKQFAVHGGAPPGAAVSAAPPPLTPAAACARQPAARLCVAAMRRVTSGTRPAVACRHLPRRPTRGRRVSAFSACMNAAERVKRPLPVAPAGDPPATTAPAGTPVLSDAEAAARVKRNGSEFRPGNAEENKRVPTESELGAFRSAAIVSAPELVTGNFTGTTDEILQWAAAKWSIDPDIVRAVAWAESSWRMSFVGDNGASLGITQVKSTAHPGTKPLSQESTAFNVDYWAAVVRDYYDGRSTWLNRVERGQDYGPGDLWGSIGAWYAGRWRTGPANDYVARVKSLLAEKPWAQSRS